MAADAAVNMDALAGLEIPHSALTNKAEYIRLVRDGVPGSLARVAATLLGDRELLGRILNVSASNLSRVYRRKALGREDSEELLDSIRVFLEARALWHSDEAVREWLTTPVPALNGERPRDLFDTFEGRSWVRQALRKIEYGEFS